MLQKKLILCLSATLLLTLGCQSKGGADEEPEAPLAPGEIVGYTRVEHQGFIIQVQDIGLFDHGQETNEALDIVRNELNAILHQYDLSQSVLNSLKQWTFFIDWNTGFGDIARFHASKNWLVNNGFILEKLNSIEVSNVGYFLHFTELNRPNLLLHEIAHLYHITTLTTNYEPIYQAFLNARESGIYNSVSYHEGNGSYLENVVSPAVSDQLDYFAELTEAYFGTNDYFPFNREQLKEHDPQGFAVVESVWKD